LKNEAIALEGARLTIAGNALLTGVERAELIADELGAGAFLRFSVPEPADRLVISIGRLDGIDRWTCSHRYDPFWMSAKAGTDAQDIPIETQFLLGERTDGNVVILVPLVEEPFRCSLEGSADGNLRLVAETGDPGTTGQAVTGLFVAAGPDPYVLAELGARSVAAYLRMGRLRREKPLPAWIDQFGWCTWDAFYHDVSHEKVREGLESFAEGGVQPKMLILDDGWQSVNKAPTGENRLTAFAANEKFGGDLSPTVRMAKDEFGIGSFLVWHALNGYWGGVDADLLPGYGVRYQKRRSSPGCLSYGDEWDKCWGATVGVVAPEHIDRFFHDYHRDLRRQGIDGVKVDSQGTLETVSAGIGSRVMLMRRYHEGLEGSVHVHFQGNLINCMSEASEMLYGAPASSITRTSTDFWPNKPESHGVHLYVNAQVGLWFGEWVHPDWDMFQSAHAMGSYHAAGRVVGGSPLYVSDKPDSHDFELLRMLVLPGGDILRADGPGRPTRSCLFQDPTRDDVLLTVFNTVQSGAAGLIGAFHARYAGEGQEQAPIAGSIGPTDVAGLAGEDFAVYAHKSGELRRMGVSDRWALTLPPLDWELFSVVPLRSGLAPIGLVDLLNSPGSVTWHTAVDPQHHEIVLRAGGRFLAWSANEPSRVLLDGEAAHCTYDTTSGRLELTIAGTNEHTIVIELA
jgi:raffinose synthase